MNRLLGLPRLLRRTAPAVGQTPADVVHRENKWSLLRYRARPQGLASTTPILLVPSLINRHYVLDLMPGKSFVQWLVEQGHDVYIIDWGTPADEDRYLSFDDICDRYIGRAIRVACRTSGVPKLHLLGYCLGGTLAVIHTAVHPERIASLAVLAAPIDFHDDGLLSRWSRTRTFDVKALVAATGLVPWPLMQLSFHLLKPTMNLGKAVTVVDRIWDDAFLDAFLAVERWGNDNVSFPGRCYAQYIERLYRQNALIEGTMRLGGQPVALSAITCPTLAVTFRHDHIVPEPSAAALLPRIGSEDKQHIALPGGHVGAVVSKKAAQGLWPQLATWWNDHDPNSRTAVQPPTEPRTADVRLAR